jgi:hypothetical protein
MLGDRVLVAVTGEEAFVLAVLQRETSGVTLGEPGDLDVKVAAGRLRMAATSGIDFASSEHVGLTGRELKITARSASVLVDHLSHIGTSVSATLTQVKMKTVTLESTVDRVTETIKRAYRFVSEFEHVRARRIDYAAKETMSLRGENTMVGARELVKIDGAQIHLG